MKNWFECKIKYEKTGEDGRLVAANETYLVEAISHAEAENRIVEEMKAFISGQFTVEKVAKKKFWEILSKENAEKWYRVKVVLVSIDEAAGVEKLITVMMLVQANDISEALALHREAMKDTMSDYYVCSITETPVMDVYVQKNIE
jgi:hypothetical protein